MDKDIGFHRNIHRPWLDATAAFALETNNADDIRARLDPLIYEEIKSSQNRRKAIDILLNIWVKSADTQPQLRNEALHLFAKTEVITDRIWLHYGLTLLCYPFFRLGCATMGMLSRYSDVISSKAVKQRIFDQLGQSGAVDKATERIVFSLRDWGILTTSSQRYTYTPLRQSLTTARAGVEQWMLAVALTANPAEELPFPDLVRLPELFPFRFTLSVEDIRQSPRFEVHRQGLAWDMVGLAPQVLGSNQPSLTTNTVSL